MQNKIYTDEDIAKIIYDALKEIIPQVGNPKTVIHAMLSEAGKYIASVTDCSSTTIDACGNLLKVYIKQWKQN